jgi:hypothetical protein
MSQADQAVDASQQPQQQSLSSLAGVGATEAAAGMNEEQLSFLFLFSCHPPLLFVSLRVSSSWWESLFFEAIARARHLSLFGSMILRIWYGASCM